MQVEVNQTTNKAMSESNEDVDENVSRFQTSLAVVSGVSEDGEDREDGERYVSWRRASKSRPQSAKSPADRLKAQLRARDETIEALERELAMHAVQMLQLRGENERLKAALAAAQSSAGAGALQAIALTDTPRGKGQLPPLDARRVVQRRPSGSRPASARPTLLDSARQLSEMD